MTTRIKFTQPITRARAEELLGEVATLTLERNHQTIAMDRQITAIREQFEQSLGSLGKQLEEKTALLEAWASANPDEFPKNRKSIEFVHGLIGYRTGTPKLKTLPRWTWARVLELLQNTARLPWLRITTAINKEQILSDFAQAITTEAELKTIGVQVVQDETFFLEPKLEDLDTRTTQEAA